MRFLFFRFEQKQSDLYVALILNQISKNGCLGILV